ncbi:MAG: GNAT family N-acetyltransferase [Planctomycetia bacterium]|jgi:GNAT superfamily N-acetyltransferase
MTENGHGITAEVLVCRDLTPAATAECWGHVLRPIALERDADAVADLAAVVARTVRKTRPQPTAAGLMAELRGRPDRQVSCWLAWAISPAGKTGTAGPSGLVTLVESRGRTGAARFSISWLIVRPDARRQGLGRALVAAAVSRARSAGADVVWTETSRDWPAAEFWRAVGFVPSRPAG